MESIILQRYVSWSAVSQVTQYVLVQDAEPLAVWNAAACPYKFKKYELLLLSL